ncbi:peptidase S41-like protein [Mangrovibacterium diazotrophicum]|uniref:Peptidase S41-like protein n=1 Tax=Mangrovibacterium diazotrophicum TaxID=1261403 RepID=A0A419W400_9BACT|nr:peptidase S41-like protein [Mangrovibacterium diazotrophicum]
MFLSFVIAISLVGSAQENECLNDFDYLVEKIKNDYPGYKDKVNDETLADLKALEHDLRNRIIQYPDSCGKCLGLYTFWFKDNHLRVKRRSISRSTVEQAKTQAQYYDITIDSISNSGQSIEGIWIGFRGKIAVTKENDGSYVGIAIRYPNFEGNQVMFEFSELGNNEFCVTSVNPAYSYNHKGKAALYIDNKILEINGDTWFVRQSSNETLNKAFLYSYTPKNPNGTNTYPVATSLSDSTYYLRITDFESDYSNSIVTQHWQEIMSRPNLIIDLRNNGGGQDNYFQKLAELIYTNPYETKGVEWYASKGNIEFFEEALKAGEIIDGEEGIRWTESLLDAMKKNVGGFVTVSMFDDDKVDQTKRVYLNPKKVGIIINERNASSAEQFLLAAKNSQKVTLFGNHNTAGVLDYSNAVSQKFPSGNFDLIFPMTRSQRLPEHPFDNIGIAPDILIPFPSTDQLYDRLDDWAYFVKNYLELMK